MFDKGLRDALRNAYASSVEYRDRLPLEKWKAQERVGFNELLDKARVTSLLELGAGPGRDAAFFASHGKQVIASDLTYENAAACRQKGLNAVVLDVCAIAALSGKVESAYAFNCLLHLPRAEFPLALNEIHRVLKAGGLFYLGQYGGVDREAVWEEDFYRPPRFFSFFSDEALPTVAASCFDIISFKQNPLSKQASGLHFQSLILQKTAS